MRATSLGRYTPGRQGGRSWLPVITFSLISLWYSSSSGTPITKLAKMIRTTARHTRMTRLLETSFKACLLQATQTIRPQLPLTWIISTPRLRMWVSTPGQSLTRLVDKQPHTQTRNWTLRVDPWGWAAVHRARHSHYPGRCSWHHSSVPY
jgi:hypothetical protein